MELRRILVTMLGAGALCLIVAGDAFAETPTAVHFADGRVLRVAELRADGASLHLTLEGGGYLTVPAARVERWQPIVLAVEPAAPPSPEMAAWREAAGSYADLIAEAARSHQVDPALLTAMARVESSFDPAAVSPKGASGLLQLMPATAERFGVADVFDVTQNVDAGARYLRWLLERFEGRTDLALAGYNAGEGAVDRHRGIPPYPETQNYVVRVMGHASRLGGGVFTAGSDTASSR